MVPKAIKESIVILLIALVLTAGAYGLRPSALPLSGSPAPVQPQQQDDALYKSLDIEQAEGMFKEGTALFADARTLTDYEESHIAGAVHLDPYDMGAWSDAVIDQYPPEQIIIAYCHGTQCDLSNDLAEKLTWLGFEQVYYLNDGWGQWLARGLPVE